MPILAGIVILIQFCFAYHALKTGSFLARLGQHEAAGHMFNEVIKYSKRFASSVEDEARWELAARKAIGN